MRFLDCTGGEKIPSASLLDVGVENAIQHSGFDEAMFFKRGGKYTWTKFEMKHTSLDWWSSQSWNEAFQYWLVNYDYNPDSCNPEFDLFGEMKNVLYENTDLKL